MNKARRQFLSQLTLLGGAAALSTPLTSATAVGNYVDEFLPSSKTAGIFHTNDLHGNLPELKQIKTAFANEGANGMMLDAGGFINLAKSVSEQNRMIYTMNAMGYKAAGLSNNELAQGHDKLAELALKMQFAIVNCNHQFEGDLAWVVKPYITFKYNNIKVGVTGVSSPLTGVKYSDASQSANKTAAFLKHEQKCDLVICLSHLKNDGKENANQELAKRSEHIDMIIAGGNGKLYPNALVLHNKVKHEVILAQTASKGLMAGNTFINFNKNKQKANVTPKSFIPGDDDMYQTAFAKLKLNRAVAKSA